jgi:hypothetical protein
MNILRGENETNQSVCFYPKAIQAGDDGANAGPGTSDGRQSRGELPLAQTDIDQQPESVDDEQARVARTAAAEHRELNGHRFDPRRPCAAADDRSRNRLRAEVTGRFVLSLAPGTLFGGTADHQAQPEVQLGSDWLDTRGRLLSCSFSALQY